MGMLFAASPLINFSCREESAEGKQANNPHPAVRGCSVISRLQTRSYSGRDFGK